MFSSGINKLKGKGPWFIEDWFAKANTDQYNSGQTGSIISLQHNTGCIFFNTSCYNATEDLQTLTDDT